MLTASVSGETCTNLMFALRLEVPPSPPLHAASDKAKHGRHDHCNKFPHVSLLPWSGRPILRRSQ